MWSVLRGFGVFFRLFFFFCFFVFCCFVFCWLIVDGFVVQTEAKAKKQKHGEEKNLDMLLLEWAGAKKKGRSGQRVRWKKALAAQTVHDVEDLKERAQGSFWRKFLEKIAAADSVLATKLELWKQEKDLDDLLLEWAGRNKQYAE